MAVSTADFYAYAQATGTEVPSSKKEQAKIAPAVHQWRRSQLKQKQQENQPDLGDVVAWTGLGTGALAAAFLRDPSRARQVRDKVGKLKQGYNELRNNIADKIAADPSSGINTSATIDTSKQVTPKENVQTLIDKVQLSTSQSALEKLQAQGIPEFESTARIQAYATTGNQNFLEPSFNANTLPSGLEGFRSALGLKNIQINEKNQIIGGDLMNPTGEVPRSLRDSAKQTIDGEAYDAGVRQLESEGAPEGGYAVTRSMPVSGAGISQADPEAYTKAARKGQKPQQVVGEQYRIANEEFSRQWDSLAQEGYVEPRTINRVVEPTELDLEVRSELRNSDGIVIEPAVTYGEKLLKEDPASYALLSQGTSVKLDAPYQLNKAKDLELVKQNAFTPEGEVINPELINEWKGKYNPTSERLQGLHKTVFGKITSDDAFVSSELSLSDRLLEPLEGEVVTPRRGPGSQKGQQVGGMVTPYVPEPIYNLQYVPDPYSKNNMMKVVAIGNLGPYDLTNIKNLKGIEVLGKTGNNFDEIVSQPMTMWKEIKGQKPIGTTSAGKQVVWATPETVQAPLQVQKYSPTGEFLEEVQGKINRLEIKNTLEEIKQQGIAENAAANMVRSQVPKGGLPKQELSNLIAQTSKQTGINPNLIVERLRTGGAADTSPIGLGKQLQSRLLSEKQIKLPVLDSYQSYDFIDNILGFPKDQMGKRRAVTKDKLGGLKPVSEKNLVLLQQLGLQDYDPKTKTRKYTSKVFDPALSRVPKGEPSVNIVDSPKKTTSSYDRQYEQTGWNEWEKTYDNTNPLSVNYQGRVESGSNAPMGDIRTPKQIAATWNKKRQSQGLPADITIEDAQRYKEKGFLPTSGPGSLRKPRYTSDLTIIPGKQEYVPIDQTVDKNVTEIVTARLLKQGKKPLSDTSGTGLALTHKYTPAQATDKAVTWTLRKPSANDLLTETVNELTEFRKDPLGLSTPNPDFDLVLNPETNRLQTVFPGSGSNTLNKTQRELNKRQSQLEAQGSKYATPSELWIQEGNAPTRNMFTNIETQQYNTPVASSQTTLSPTVIKQAEDQGIDELRRSSQRSSKRRNR